MIKELLETRIRPAVMEDGGDIVFQVSKLLLSPSCELQFDQLCGLSLWKRIAAHCKRNCAGRWHGHAVLGSAAQCAAALAVEPCTVPK